MSKFRSVIQSAANATKKAFSWKLEDMLPPTEKHLFSFQTKEDLKMWNLYADSKFGGLTSASLEIKEDGGDATGIFSGNLSLDQSLDSDWTLKRGGFCGIRSQFKGYLDLDPYNTLNFRVRGDGRCYISSIHTENWVNGPGEDETNIWQAFIFAPKGHWTVVKIPFVRYKLTWRGSIIDQEREINLQRVVGMSIGVNAQGGPRGTVTGPGEFKLELQSVKASRSMQ